MMQKIIWGLLCFYSAVSLAHDTVLKLYRPYGDATEQAIPIVKSSLYGECFAQSQLIVREDAWRCISGENTYDPCFVKPGPDRTEALCPESPWVGDSVQIRVKSPLNNEQNKTLDMSLSYPWAIELANGEHCQAIQSGMMYDQMPVRYKCAHMNYLLGHLQRCATQWSMLEKTPQGVITVVLDKAWF